MTRDYSNEGVDPDDADDFTGRCHGNPWRTCGRFVGPRQYHCARCLAELEADYQQEQAREAAWQNEQAAREQAAWDEYMDSPEVQAEMARIEQVEAERREIEARIKADPKYVAPAWFEDLPF
jgi:hypothetical protein